MRDTRYSFFVVFAMLLLFFTLSFTACVKVDQSAYNSTAPDNQTEEPKAEPVSEQTEEPMADATPEPIPDGTHFYLADAFDKPGEIALYPTLIEKLAKDTGSDTAHSVWIVARFFPGAADLTFGERTYAELRSDPALFAFEAEYRDWLRQDYIPQYVEMLERMRGGDSEALAWMECDACEMFYDEWVYNVSEESLNAYDAANALYRAAKKALNCEDDPSAARAALDEELARLKALGYALELKSEPSGSTMAFDLYGELTAEQLFGLAADPNWAYCIYPWPLDHMHG